MSELFYIYTVLYRNSDGVATDNTGVVAGIVTALDIPVTVTNAGEDAFGANIGVNFTNVFNFVRAVPVEAENEVCWGDMCRLFNFFEKFCLDLSFSDL